MSHTIYVDPSTPMTVAASLAGVDLAQVKDSSEPALTEPACECHRMLDRDCDLCWRQRQASPSAQLQQVPSPAAFAILVKLWREAFALCKAVHFAQSSTSRDLVRRLEEKAGIVAMLLSELIKLKVVDMVQIRQYGRDHAELLAAKPALIAPHVVVVDPDACEHQHWQHLLPSACPSCKMEFVSCGVCDEVHFAPVCEDA